MRKAIILSLMMAFLLAGSVFAVSARTAPNFDFSASNAGSKVDLRGNTDTDLGGSDLKSSSAGMEVDVKSASRIDRSPSSTSSNNPKSKATSSGKKGCITKLDSQGNNMNLVTASGKVISGKYCVAFDMKTRKVMSGSGSSSQESIKASWFRDKNMW